MPIKSPKPTEYAPFIVKVNALIAEMSAKAHARKEASGDTNETAKELADVGQGAE